jgi:hypothetical protein
MRSKIQHNIHIGEVDSSIPSHELPAKMMRDDPMRDVVCHRRHHLQSRVGVSCDETLSSTLRDERQPSCTQE